MLYYVTLKDEFIVGYDIPLLAKIKAYELFEKHAEKFSVTIYCTAKGKQGEISFDKIEKFYKEFVQNA